MSVHTHPDLTGRLAIDGTSLHTPAWNATNLMPLWARGDVRGNSVVMPGSPGVRPKPKRVTITRRSIPMAFTGTMDEDGNRYANTWIGLEANLDTFYAAVVDQPGTGDGTRNAVLTMPSGSVRSRDIHVLGLSLGATVEGINTITGDYGTLLLATLDLEIPDGAFVAGGS